MPESPAKACASQWLHPNQVLKLHKLKAKKKALQARINKTAVSSSIAANKTASSSFSGSEASLKRRNPFTTAEESKKSKLETDNAGLDDTSDQTLFKLLHLSSSSSDTQVDSQRLTSFNNVLKHVNADTQHPVQIVKAKGEIWIPVDWSLKTKIRFLSTVPFAWNQKLKISEEASGITGFTRCLDANNTTSLDTSPNAKFHQCCLYWQHPALPWLTLFPRTSSKGSVGLNMFGNSAVRESLQAAWTDSFRSVFQLIRTRQCPYFYVCANNFTVLFRAGGISGFTEMHAMITPTTRGFRHLMRQEEIEYCMPLKAKRLSDQGYETADSTRSSQASENVEALTEVDEEEPPDEQWLQSMGINAEDIKQINYTQAQIVHKSECKVDNSEESLVLVEGMEVHALYNFLINCKSTTTTTGSYAGVPPTLLAPVAFQGATLNSLKVRQNKVHVDNADYYSLELLGPVLPSVIHNLCLINPSHHSLTATFSDMTSTVPFSKIKRSAHNSNLSDENISSGSLVFGKENLSDCGLNSFVLQRFCSPDPQFICNVECLKYTGDTNSFTWT